MLGKLQFCVIEDQRNVNLKEEFVNFVLLVQCAWWSVYVDLLVVDEYVSSRDAVGAWSRCDQKVGFISL